MGAVCPRQTTTYFLIFSFLRAKRAKRQRRPLLQQVTIRFKLPVHCWKRSFQLGAFSGDANANSLPTVNNYLFADLFLFTSREGDETISSSFTIRYAAIEASSALLEALIASLLSTCGPAKEATFPTAIRLLIAVGSLVACADGEGQRRHHACRWCCDVCPFR